MTDAPVSPTSTVPPPRSFTITDWLICIIASIGFLFDTYELLMLPVTIRPAIEELVPAPPVPANVTDADAIKALKVKHVQGEFDKWYPWFFFLPALFGGVFGLMGGYFTDKYGRQRVLTWSILLYSGSALMAGLSSSMWMLLFFRITTFIGVCVEFVAACAWLAELFPNPKQRESVLGYTQAFSSFGGLFVALVGETLLDPSKSIVNRLPAIHGQHEGWRWVLISGLIPAIPLILIRPFLPESPVWLRRRADGTLKRPSLAQLFSPQLLQVTMVSALMFACTLGVAFGAIQHLNRVVPALRYSGPMPEAKGKAGAKELAKADAGKADGVKTDAEKDDAAKKASAKGAADGKAPADSVQRVPVPLRQKLVATIQKYQEFGGLLGRFALAFIALKIASRRSLIRLFQIPGLIITPIVFLSIPHMEPWSFQIGMFFVGFFAVAQLSFWGNYLPTVYPVHLRGTGESFAANVGGRMIGTSMALVSSILATKYAPSAGGEAIGWAWACATVGTAMYVLGLILSFFLPESKPELENQ